MYDDHVWINRKNGKHYVVLGEVINCTNAQDGQIMIYYRFVDDCTVLPFVREKNEFFEKFRRGDVNDFKRDEEEVR